MALDPLIIRWGEDASSDLLQRSARCTHCGGKVPTFSIRARDLATQGWLSMRKRRIGARSQGEAELPFRTHGRCLAPKGLQSSK
jgi:hypothetical protein